MSVCYDEEKIRKESGIMFNFFPTQMSVTCDMSKANGVRHGFCVGENQRETVVSGSMSI